MHGLVARTRIRALVVAISWAPLTVAATATAPASGPGPGVATMSAGGSHTCALRTDGTVWCWGDNRLGQLGQGSADDDPHSYPLKVLFP